jgi:hypothetical protein
MAEHQTKTVLDPQLGGWIWTCSCGEQAKRPSWYKARALGQAKEHLESEAPLVTAPLPTGPLPESGGGSS